MPNLVVVARTAELNVVGAPEMPPRRRIFLTGKGECPGSKVIHSFKICHGNERRADGWEVPIRVLLCRASPEDAYIPEKPMSGKLLVGMLFAGWTEPESDGVAAKPLLQMRLNLPSEQFDALAASLPHDVHWRVSVGAASWYPTPILLRGLTHGHDPDGRDMVWDTEHASQTELDTFKIDVAPNPKERTAEISAGDLKSLTLSLQQIREVQDRAVRWTRRTYWLLLVAGTLTLLAAVAG